MPGFSDTPERIKAMRDLIDNHAQRKRDIELKRKFLAEPEELAVLDAIAKMPPMVGAAAAEGALIARRWRKLGRPK